MCTERRINFASTEHTIQDPIHDPGDVSVSLLKIGRFRVAPAALFAALAVALVARAQPELFVAAPSSSGVIEVEAQEYEQVVAAMILDEPGVPWMRVKFGDVLLPKNSLGASYLRITSLLDGAEQRLNADQLEQWLHHSAYFNGSQVLVELVVPKGVKGSARIKIDGYVSEDPQGSEKSLCDGSDDRSLLEHPAIARVMPIKCTAWLIDTCNKCLVTAGHCTNGSAGVVQFNVPPSLPDGTLVFPGPDDQYAVDGDVTLSTGLGNAGTEFGLMQVHPNPNTDLMPFEVQTSAFALADQIPQSGDLVSVAGYGTDDTLGSDPGIYNFVLRTHSGAIVSASTDLIEYRADSSGGNSGSPVIDDATGRVVAIHTHGGCNSVHGNKGTSTTRPMFLDAIADIDGPCVCPGLAVVPITIPAEVMLPGHPESVVMQVLRPGNSGKEIVADAVKLDWAVDDGPVGTVQLAPLGNGKWGGDLPAIACGEVVRFSVTAVVDQETARWPINTQQIQWAVSGWQMFEFASFDFEQDPGWEVGSAINTNGDWGLGVPTNEPSKLTPPSDADGSGNCWLTGPLEGNNDVDGGPTTLTTEWFKPATGEAIILEYARYFANDDRDDRLTIEMQTFDGGWELLESVSTDPLWRTVKLPVRSANGEELPFRIRFTAVDAPNNSITEAAIDAFKIKTVSCELACAADLNGDGVVDFDDFLEWLSLAGIPFSRGDLNGDGMTDDLDLSIMLSRLFEECVITKPRTLPASSLTGSNEPHIGN